MVECKTRQPGEASVKSKNGGKLRQPVKALPRFAYKDWTIENWKKVIFSNETSVQMGGVRSRRRIWRKKEETFHEHVVTRR